LHASVKMRMMPAGGLGNVPSGFLKGAFVQIAESRAGDVTILRPSGRIDNETSPAFQSRLLATLASAKDVLLDLEGVEYVSSAGLRALMVASKQSKTSQGRIGVTSLQPVVKEIFAISRFAFVVPVFDKPADAIAAWK